MEEIISFTNEIKNEITANINLDTEMKRSLLAAFIRVNGTIKFKNKLLPDLLIEKLTKYKIDKILIEESTLEDMFLHYYK